MTHELHPIQRKILTDLLFGNQLKFSQLKPQEMEGSQFTFHLNKLLEANLLAKHHDYYSLTPNGKNIANSFDPDSPQPGKQAKHSVVFGAFRRNSNSSETLLYTRKKNPFYNHQGYPTGKVIYGQSIIETAQRELFEETGLQGKAILVGIRHYRVYYPSPDHLVEDKVMYVCRIDEPTGQLNPSKEGEFVWVDLSDINDYLTRPLPEFRETFQILTSFTGQLTFLETNHYPENF